MQLKGKESGFGVQEDTKIFHYNNIIDRKIYKTYKSLQLRSYNKQAASFF